MENIDIGNLIVQASKLPIVKVDRELFLRKELRNRYNNNVVELAIKHNPAYAGIPVEDIDKIAKSCITADTAKVTALSAAAGIPGGLAMLGTIPADITQYFGHIIHILQELIYLYGWQDLTLDKNELNEETKNILTLFIGIMFGVNGAANAVNKIAAQVAANVAKKLPQKALMKTAIYPIVKKVAALIGVKMTRDIFAKGVSKAIPVAGAVLSGGLTFATFTPMANKLKKYLASNNMASVEYYERVRNGEVVDAEIIDEEIVDDLQNENN